ncbi:hypothetical protein [Rubripirellula reticaptiva]|uniref:HEAT repeat protein n=1 Tax=Rubripirellula reticaptiva TaxID=2528013 RepID=A0A5C6EPS2_9BACT|nr:hypothetical protein [Rubripirellula reticaptiva]TWU51112.1 hypothetical protein Poly59_27010 [Rubripirellula reticaptiva]
MTAESILWSEKLAAETKDQGSILRQMAESADIRGCTAAVIKLANSQNVEVRKWATAALESSITPTPDEVEAISDLLACIDEGETCYWAATMLGRLGPNVGPRTKLAVDSLEICLGDSMYLPARERSAWALSQIGPSAASAAITLRRTAEDAPPRLQRLVEEALEMIGEAA